MALANPIQDFLKFAKSTNVEAHTRTVGGKQVLVTAHDRKVDDVSADIEAARAAKKARELEMWRKWKEGGEKKEDLAPLIKSFTPMIKSKVNVYANKVRIPPSAIELAFQVEFVNALKSYDPNKGAALGTYVFRYLDKGRRWIAENQNIGRIPENRIYKIQEFKNSKGELMEELGREPTTKELAASLEWSEAEVDRMESEQRTDLVTQGFEEDPFALIPSKTEEVLRLFKYEVSGEQREIYEYLTGYGKPKITSTGEIAKKTGLKDYQVSRIKAQIEKKLRRYLDGYN